MAKRTAPDTETPALKRAKDVAIDIAEAKEEEENEQKEEEKEEKEEQQPKWYFNACLPDCTSFLRTRKPLAAKTIGGLIRSPDNITVLISNQDVPGRIYTWHKYLIFRPDPEGLGHICNIYLRYRCQEYDLGAELRCRLHLVSEDVMKMWGYEDVTFVRLQDDVYVHREDVVVRRGDGLFGNIRPLFKLMADKQTL